MNTHISSLAGSFEQLVRKILEAHGFVIPTVSHGRQDFGYDFKARLQTEEWAVEVKFYRTARAQVTLIESAASRLVSQARRSDVFRGMLVVSSYVPPAIRQSLETNFGLTLIDRGELRNWAAETPKLLDELNGIVELDPTVELSSTVAREVHARPVETLKAPKLLPTVPPAEDTQGATLCSELRALKRGRSTWAAYERLCDRIVRYLFPNDLHGWHRQRRTDDGLNRFDYVCRIRPTTEFWQFLLHHLDSRYVLFEFKNYRGRIKQGQVLTTEKYLLERGLRRVAIVISRAGADKDAVQMAQGAMREHGKLMLILDDDNVCEMLHMKERGEDPTDRLFEIADDFLLSLPR